MTDTQALVVLKKYFGDNIRLSQQHGLHLVLIDKGKAKMDFPGKQYWDRILATLKEKHSID